MTGPFWHFMGVTWDKAIFSTLCQHDAAHSAQCPENLQKPVFTIISDVNSDVPWHPTLHYAYKKVNQMYLQYVHTPAFICQERRKKPVLCQHKTERPWTRFWLPLLLQRNCSVQYKRMWYVWRLHHECVWPSSYSHLRPWQSRVNRNLFLSNYFWNKCQKRIIVKFRKQLFTFFW